MLAYVFLKRRSESIECVLLLVDTLGLKGSALAAKGKRMPYGEEGGRRMSKTLYWR